MTDSIKAHQIKNLPIRLAELAAGRFAESLDEAQKAMPTWAPLRILTLLEDICEASSDIFRITVVALDMVDDNTDLEQAEAVLKGAKAMNLDQSRRVWELVGLVLHYMQQHTPTPQDGHSPPSVVVPDLHLVPGTIQ